MTVIAKCKYWSNNARLHLHSPSGISDDMEIYSGMWGRCEATRITLH